MNDATYSIGELAERAGVSRRTVRYYVQRGLLPDPLGRGRGRHYDDRHLSRLLQIKAMQEQGLPLEEIGEAVSAPAPEPAPPPGLLRLVPGSGRPEPELAPAPGRRLVVQPVMPGYELAVTENATPLSASQLEALAAFLSYLTVDDD